MRENLEALLAQGQDNALLRFSLGNLCLTQGDPGAAIEHLQRAVEHDADYSAAWKMLGKAHLACDQREQACAAWRRGIQVAERRGDRQAVKEMSVFLRRVDKTSGT